MLLLLPLDWGCGPWLAVTVGHHGEGGIDGTRLLVKTYTSCWSRAAASRWTWAIHCLSGTQLSEERCPPFSFFLVLLTSLSFAAYDEVMETRVFFFHFCQSTRFFNIKMCSFGFLTSLHTIIATFCCRRFKIWVVEERLTFILLYL